jgi:hypothetical protein
MRARAGGGLVIAAVLTLAACGGGGGGDESAPAAAALIRSTADATAGVRSFHFGFEIDNAPPNRPGLNLTFATGDIAVPDKLRAEVAGTLSGISIRSELIFVGDQHYLKDPISGRWRTLDAETSPIAFFDPAKGVLSVIRGARDVELAGSETVGGVDTYRLEGVVEARDVTPILGNEPTGRLVDLELWIGKEDSILRRLRLSGPISDDEADDIVRTVEISQFDEPFAIEPPADAR